MRKEACSVGDDLQGDSAEGEQDDESDGGEGAVDTASALHALDVGEEAVIVAKSVAVISEVDPVAVVVTPAAETTKAAPAAEEDAWIE